MEDALNRHSKIALQLSGGRDSIACLYLLRPHLDRITVYWCNTGAAFPETLQVIEQIKAMAPNFVEIEGRQPATIEQFGIPSDLVPVSSTPMGILGEQTEAPLIQDRYSCCFRSIMLPMHERMIADGVTLIIRGQKDADRMKGCLRSGSVENGVEYLYPLEDWTSRKVMDFLKEQNAPIPRFYEVMDGTPDCMTCSAWWEEGRALYLKRYHHDAYVEYQRRLDVINRCVGGHIATFNDEVNV